VRAIEEQTILVTGSTDGLGRAVAAELARRGSRVLVHGRDPGKVTRVVEQIGAARGLVADLSSLEDVRRLADQVDQLDTLLNNAGIALAERAESHDGHELTLAVNHLSCSRRCCCPSCASPLGSSTSRRSASRSSTSTT
jgi:NAD(P)-dependent dehydrogenase (short-subunit alcohol dehydrogenase family)